MNGIAAGLENFANRIWYGNSKMYLLLLPLTAIFAAIADVRRRLYRIGVIESHRLSAPVIVVGNITVGGAGKTPVTLWLTEDLRKRGLKPAIISRGYGGNSKSEPLLVDGDSDPFTVGDEPVLLARRSGCRVYVGSDRVRAAQKAIDDGANIIVSDDGLQHYRMRRDAEIAVVDGVRGLGNGHLLPAGPLREPRWRLDAVDRILVQCEVGGQPPRYGNRASDIRITRFMLAGGLLINVRSGRTRTLSSFAGTKVHAVAGIGNPQRFFDYLSDHDIEVIPHALQDHAHIKARDISFGDDVHVLMTEKDAVKCIGIDHERLWYLPVNVVFNPGEKLAWLDVLHDSVSAVARKKHD